MEPWPTNTSELFRLLGILLNWMPRRSSSNGIHSHIDLVFVVVLGLDVDLASKNRTGIWL